MALHLVKKQSFDGINLYIGEESIILGCTDSLALNYNPDANQDDGSCEDEKMNALSYFKSKLEIITIIQMNLTLEKC